MINVVCAVSTTTAIKAPPIINGADAQLSPRSPSIGFGIFDFLAGVLGYFPAALEVGS